MESWPLLSPVSLLLFCLQIKKERVGQRKSLSTNFSLWLLVCKGTMFIPGNKHITLKVELMHRDFSLCTRVESSSWVSELGFCSGWAGRTASPEVTGLKNTDGKPPEIHTYVTQILLLIFGPLQTHLSFSSTLHFFLPLKEWTYLSPLSYPWITRNETLIYLSQTISLHSWES